MKNYKSIICVVAAVCLLGTAAFCGFRIYHYYAEVDEQTETFEEIAEMVEQAPTEMPYIVMNFPPGRRSLRPCREVPSSLQAQD